MAHNTTKQFGIPPDSFLGTFEVLIDAEKAADVILKPGEDEDSGYRSNVHHSFQAETRSDRSGAGGADKFRSPQDVFDPLASLDGIYDYHSRFWEWGSDALPTVAAQGGSYLFISYAGDWNE